MKTTKEKILDTSLELFNEHGVASVSLRQVAKELGISHGNLIYHYTSKNEIIETLHKRLLDKAIEENKKLKETDSLLENFKQVNEIGFEMVYNYKFFFIDLVQIMKGNKKLHKDFLEAEKIRFAMYHALFEKLISGKLMRQPEYPAEYTELIERIRIYSDFWVSSSAIYCQTEKPRTIEKHVRLLLATLYPYLTKKGKEHLKQTFEN